jgi:uncharacterized Zn-finger protein
MDIKCRLCLFKTEQDESVNIFTIGKNNELISDTITSFVPIELSPDDNLPQTICNVCVQKLDSIIEFRSLILNSDAELKIKWQNKKIIQKSENEISGASDDIKLEIDEVKLEIDETIREQNDEGHSSRKGVKHRKYTPKKRKKNLYKCEECDVTFKCKYKYVAHNTRHTGNMPYHCDICNKGFSMKYRVRYHRRVHFEDRPFKCDECTKAFKFQASLKMHKKLHQNVRPHKCDMCDKSFIQKGSLENHRRQHTGEKPFICEYCSKRFASSDALKQHDNTHKKGPYLPCPTCGKFYPNNFYLKCHIRKAHTDDKEYTCEMCQKNSHQSNGLKIDMKTHSGETSNPCTLCNKKFASSLRLRLLGHIKKEHSVLPLM